MIRYELFQQIQACDHAQNDRGKDSKEYDPGSFRTKPEIYGDHQEINYKRRHHVQNTYHYERLVALQYPSSVHDCRKYDRKRPAAENIHRTEEIFFFYIIASPDRQRHQKTQGPVLNIGSYGPQSYKSEHNDHINTAKIRYFPAFYSCKHPDCHEKQHNQISLRVYGHKGQIFSQKSFHNSSPLTIMEITSSTEPFSTARSG